METLTFKIQDFEGPLDLLLHLIEKNKMDLRNIDLMPIIDQYNALVFTMQHDQMDTASAFIDMAARLVQLKSSLLLPRSPQTERMKAELTGALMEYSLCKKMARQLGVRANTQYTVVREPLSLIGAPPYSRRQSPDKLARAWYSLMDRNLHRKTPSQQQFDPLVAAPTVSVTSRAFYLLRGMLSGRIRRFRQLFSRDVSCSTNVATFLALLELVRSGRVSIDDTGVLFLDRTHRSHRPDVPKGESA